ncbi:MAG: GspH/FimT family pseudopilin [bacterium]
MFENRQNGFTLIELIAVVIITGILTAVITAKYNDTGSTAQREAALRKMITDIRFAQQLALTGGQETRVTIDQPNNRYFLKWEDGTYVKTPVGGQDFIVEFGTGNFSDVTISATGFTNGRLDFDRRGVPLNAGTAFSGVLSLVTLNSLKRITVTANTGFLRIEDI